MNFLYAAKIYLLTLRKMSYVLGIYLLFLLLVMVLITKIKRDKCYFTKKLNKFRRWGYGYSINSNRIVLDRRCKRWVNLCRSFLKKRKL